MVDLFSFFSKSQSAFEQARALFDPCYYLGNSTEAEASKKDPFDHFMKTGWKQGKSPSIFFDVPFYIRNNPEVLILKENPVLHFIRIGAFQGANPNVLFDTNYYLRTANLEKDINPLIYFRLQTDWAGKPFHPLFNLNLYSRYFTPSQRKENGNPLEYFLSKGGAEGLSVCEYFDPIYYRENYALVSKGINLFVHFLDIGWKNGFSPSRYFDTNYYVGQYPDLRVQNLNPLLHFVNTGHKLGARPHPDFDPSFFFNVHKFSNYDLRYKGLANQKTDRIIRGCRNSKPKQKPILIFLHLYKTGGISIREWLRWSVPPGKLFEIDNMAIPGVFKLDTIRGPLRAAQGQLQAIAGHAAFGIHEIFDRHCSYFTLLRDPIHRLVSWYGHLAKEPGPEIHEKIKNGMTLEEFLQEEDRFNMENAMCRMIAGRPRHIYPKENDPETLASAIENIRKNFCLVTTIERSQGAVHYLSRYFGLEAGFLPTLNTNSVLKTNIQMKNVNDKTLSFLRERNELDLKLYTMIKSKPHLQHN